MSKELFPNATIPRTNARSPVRPRELKPKCILCNSEQFVYTNEHKCAARNIDKDCVLVVSRNDGN